MVESKIFLMFYQKAMLLLVGGTHSENLEILLLLLKEETMLFLNQMITAIHLCREQEVL